MLEKCPNCKGNHIAFSGRCVKKTEATEVARQIRKVRLGGQASMSAARDMAMATGANSVALGPRPQGVAEGGGDGDEEEMTDVDEEDEAAGGGGQETSRRPKLRMRPGPRLTSKLRPKREPWLPMIRVIQYNCARSYKWTIAALEMGVARRADVVCLQEPPREIGGIGISHSAYKTRKRKRVWTGIRRESGLVVDGWTDLSRRANEDVIATNVRGRGERITRIVNVSDRKNTHSGEGPARKLNWQRVIRPGGTVPTGDFNAHSK